MELHEVKLPAKPHVVLCSGKVEELPSDAVFHGMKERIESNPSLLKSINGVFVYHITKSGKVTSTWSKCFFFFNKNTLIINLTCTIVPILKYLKLIISCRFEDW